MQLDRNVMPTKKPYRQPTLVIYGNIQELTKSTASGTAFDSFPLLPPPQNRSAT